MNASPLIVLVRQLRLPSVAPLDRIIIRRGQLIIPRHVPDHARPQRGGFAHRRQLTTSAFNQPQLIANQSPAGEPQDYD